jgi:hypothetical protein
VLGRIAALLEAQEASSFHVRACHDAAAQVRQLREPPPQIVEQRGCAGLEQLPVVTERRGALAGRRIVRGGEHECGRQDGVSPRESLPDAAGESAATVLALRTAAGQLGSEAPIEAIETHLSWVFLTRCHAYKLKKPARSEHFDYTTVGARRAACETELQLNRRLAASVYLGVVPVRCNGTGRHVEGNGEIVHWLLKMRLAQPRSRDRSRKMAARSGECEADAVPVRPTGWSNSSAASAPRWARDRSQAARRGSGRASRCCRDGSNERPRWT